MNTKTCNFNTGHPFADEELAVSEAELRNPSYRSNEYRLIMGLDYSYTTQERIAGKTPIEYEVELQERSQDPKIHVANSRNEKALAIWYLGSSSAFHKFLKGLSLRGMQCAFLDDQPQAVNVVFIPLDQIPALIDAIEGYLEPEPSCDLQPQLTEIDTGIRRLEKSPGSSLFNRPPHDKIAR